MYLNNLDTISSLEKAIRGITRENRKSFSNNSDSTTEVDIHSELQSGLIFFFSSFLFLLSQLSPIKA